ncbi:MAG: DNA polymerase III subunit beta [Pelosinus sp.]|nr:DNA polymerase III subunit beta [Pelosinus sp.]
MKISCAKDQLAIAVQTVQKAIASKNTMPILTGIYLTASNGKLELQANDYEIGISCIIHAEITEPGTVILSGRYFQELVRKLPGDTVEISTDNVDKTIQINSNSAQFNLLSLPVEEFPVLKPLPSSNKLVLKDNVLKELIKRTVFACATDEARPIFTGCYLTTDGFKISMVATNTHRLALKVDQLDNFGQDAATEENIHMIIPAKILAELARLLTSETPVDVTISWHKNQVSFQFDNVYIISRLIEGQYPDYNKVIPPSFVTTVKIDTSSFFDAVERISLLARDGDYNVIKIFFKNDNVVITSNNPDIGKAYETVAASITGNELEIAFNAKYITDILKNISSNQLLFSLNTPLSPACVQPIDDSSYTYIITPVRTA